MTVYCSKCGAANEDFAEFCASCGEPQTEARKVKEKAEQAQQAPSQTTSVPQDEKKLYRSRDDKVISGLAAGLAKYFDMDVNLVRILWVVAALVSGSIFIFVYLIMMLVIPLEPIAETTG
ncbi:MAG: PspC domain-containing protein [Candidatus Heimdallarchaeota archaeon]